VLNLSIITATYNASETLSDCFECIAEQNIDVEHILIYGASTDATMKMVDPHREQFAHIVTEPDKDICHTMNKGL